MDLNETVIAIQNGRHDLLEGLWKDLRGLVAWYARLYYTKLTAGGRNYGITVEDFVQSGYIALYECCFAFDPEHENSSFKALLAYYLKKEFRITVGRTDKRLRDPLNGCASLDEPVNSADPESIILADTIPDPDDAYDETEEKIYQKQLHETLEEILDTLPAKESMVLRKEYWQSFTQTEIAAQLDVSPQCVNQFHNNGINRIRRSSARKKLEQFLDDRTNYYLPVGSGRFNRTRTSSVEEIVLHREALRAVFEKHYGSILTADESSISEFIFSVQMMQETNEMIISKRTEKEGDLHSRS